MEEPTPQDKASARGYEAFVRYKRFINKGDGYGSSGGESLKRKGMGSGKRRSKQHSEIGISALTLMLLCCACAS